MSLALRGLLLRKSWGIAAGRMTLASDAPKPWNYIWQPGPYPVTKEAREAAARKYGMIPEDYEPFPDDGINSLGDYPKLKPSSADSRSGQIDWDFPDLKRNFNEPMDKDFDMYMEVGYDNTTRKRYTDVQFTMITLACAVSFFLPWFILSKVTTYPPVAEKQLCDDAAIKHYSFNIKEG